MPSMPRSFRPKPEVNPDRKKKRRHYYNSPLYSCARWRRLRRAYLNINPWCSDPFGVHTLRVQATDLDHIVPRRDVNDPFDVSNLQGLCKRCHSRKTRREQMERAT